MIKTIIITGDIDGGKSLFIKDLYDFIVLFEKDIRGFYSKGVLKNDGIKDFILVDLNSSQEIHLSTRIPRFDYISAGKFFFNPEALKIGNNIIEKAIASSSDILIIDEIGPVELSDKIWFKSFKKILSEYEGILVFSTRKKLIEPVIEKFKVHEAFIEDIERTTPRKTGEAILSLLKK